MKHLLTIIIFLFVSCSNQQIDEKIYIADLRQRSMLLDELIDYQINKCEIYHGHLYDYNFYHDMQDKFLTFNKSINGNVRSLAGSKEIMIDNYFKEGDWLNRYCDSIKAHQKFFREKDLNRLEINLIERGKLESIKNDSVLFFTLTSSLKMQVNEIAKFAFDLGCGISEHLRKAYCHDFFIFQSYTKDGSKYSVTIKNNYLFSEVPKEVYSLSFKSLKKIDENDTIDIKTKVDMNWIKDLYKTNEFTLEKGKYLFITEFKFRMPMGTIKVAEIKFDFEIK